MGGRFQPEWPAVFIGMGGRFAPEYAFRLICINFLIFSYVRKEKIHIVHANSTNAYLQCLAACKIARIPVIWHVRDYCKSKTLTKLLQKFAAHVITISDYLKESFAEHSLKNVLTIYNGVRIQELKKPTSLSISRLAKTKYVLSISQLVPWKKHDVLIDAMYHVKNVFPNLKLFILGADFFGEQQDYIEYLKIKIKKLELSNYIHFLGYVENVIPYIEHCELFVHTAEKEPLGRCLIEAMLCKKIVLAAKSGAIPEFITDNVNGFLFQPGDSIDLCQKIIDIQRRTNNDYIADNAYSTVVNMFEIFQQGSLVLKVYNNLYPKKRFN